MKKATLLQKLICLLWVFIGSSICGLGIQITLIAGIGVDPVTLFSEGVSKVSGLPVGTASVLYNVVVLTAGFFLCRKMVNWGSLVATLAIGSSINVWAAIIPAVTTDNLVLLLMINILGVLFIGLGVAVYMLPDYGSGGLEALMVYFSEKFKTPIGPTRVCMDCTCGLVGLLLGGTLGIGTVTGGVGIGMSIQLFYGLLKKVMK